MPLLLENIFPALVRSTRAGPKIVLVPPRSNFKYICLSALEAHNAVYTRCIERIHSLATTSDPARKVGVVLIFKMADHKRGLRFSYNSFAKRQKICTTNGYKDRKCSTCLGNTYNV